MKIALIGYGKMGREIEKIARKRGHHIACIIDMNNQEAFQSEEFRSADVAIEFTVPSVAVSNYQKCFEDNIPVVSGTTGWLDQIDLIKEACEKKGQTFFYASNFSLGVNIFFTLNKYLARIMDKFQDYDVRMEEVHHTQKLDAPSGTAITLAEGILEEVQRKTNWSLDKAEEAEQLPIKAIREGKVPGIHTVIYESPVDEITIHHSAKSREGFALGAVLAAEFAAENKGFLGMEDLLKL